MSPRVYTPDHDIARDVEDLNALMIHTDAKDLYGLSWGAVIVLEATRTLPGIGTYGNASCALSRDFNASQRLRLVEPPARF